MAPRSSTKERTPPKEGHGEGFIVEESAGAREGRTVKRLVDDPGQGEVVPRFMVEGGVGLAGLEQANVKTGGGLNGSLLYRPTGSWWVGMKGAGQFTPGEGRVLAAQGGAVLRYSFLPHREANRFVLAYLQVEGGYAGIRRDRGETAFFARGAYVALSVGGSRALSTRTYLGLFFTYTLPLWTKVCSRVDGTEECGDDIEGFNPQLWHFGLSLSTSF